MQQLHRLIEHVKGDSLLLELSIILSKLHLHCFRQFKLKWENRMSLFLSISKYFYVFLCISNVFLRTSVFLEYIEIQKYTFLPCSNYIKQT